MKILKRYLIKDEAQLLFAKVDMKNLLKNRVENLDFFTFALMELGTNIIKYASVGEIWVVEDDGEYLLCALDRGKGIENIEWAKRKGTTSSKSSLGLGLYQLSNAKPYKLEIFSSTSNPQGTVVLLYKEQKSSNFLIENFLHMPYGGDFCFQKGKFLIAGDVSGHGKRAYLSAEEIRRFFYKEIFSCLLIDDLFNKLHRYIMQHNLRSVVMGIIEKNRDIVNICGVGNMGVFIKDDDISYFSFKEGIVGESFSSATKLRIEGFNQLFLMSDGIDAKVMYNVINRCDNFYLSLIASLFFAGRDDDKLIVGVKNGFEEDFKRVD